jgi:hypothetical protein
MIRLRIERIVVEGLPHLSEAALREHLERELVSALSGIRGLPRRLGQPPPVEAAATERGFAVSLSASLKAVLVGR